MAKREQFWQVARGVLTSFASRNNDIRGYWGVGVLARLAKELRLPVVQLPLFPSPVESTEPVFSAISVRYGSLLVSKLAAAGIPLAWLSSADLVFQYPAPGPHARPANASIAEQPFACQLDVTDERQHRRSFVYSGWCWPQGAAPESRSTRTHDL